MAGPASTYRSFVGIARELGSTIVTSAPGNSGSTTLVVDDTTGFTAGSKITIYDGASTEVVTQSGAPSGQTLTISATANNHTTAGLLVTTVGTSSAAAADYFPVTKFDPEDHLGYAQSKGWQGSPVESYNMVVTNRSSTLDFGGDVFCDTFGYMLSGMLGDVVFGAATPNTHTFSTLTTGTGQPAKFQITDFYAAGTRQYGGVRFDELSIKASGEGLITYECKAMAYASGTVSTPTPSYSTNAPTPGYAGSVTLGGVALNKLVSADFSLKRVVEPIINIDGGPDPYSLWAGNISFDGKVQYIYPAADDTILNYFLNNTQPALSIVWNVGSGASQLGMTIQATKAAHKAAKINRGKSYIALDADVEGQANTTDAGASGGYSPVKFVLRNSRPTGTFG